jgi:hypothetical protein
LKDSLLSNPLWSDDRRSPVVKVVVIISIFVKAVVNKAFVLSRNQRFAFLADGTIVLFKKLEISGDHNACHNFLNKRRKTQKRTRKSREQTGCSLISKMMSIEYQSLMSISVVDFLREGTFFLGCEGSDSFLSFPSLPFPFPLKSSFVCDIIEKKRGAFQMDSEFQAAGSSGSDKKAITLKVLEEGCFSFPPLLTVPNSGWTSRRLSNR